MEFKKLVFENEKGNVFRVSNMETETAYYMITDKEENPVGYAKSVFDIVDLRHVFPYLANKK